MYLPYPQYCYVLARANIHNQTRIFFLSVLLHIWRVGMRQVPETQSRITLIWGANIKVLETNCFVKGGVVREGI